MKSWREIPTGSTVLEPGNISEYKTGGWRTFRPVINHEKCIKCLLCWLYCPDESIVITEKGEFEVNLDYCKGCGICAKECPKEAITMVREGQE